MVQKSRLPRSKEEFEDREAKGLWNAIALANKIGESDERITLDTLLRIHRTMLGFAYPDVAGKFRREGQDVKKLKCVEPPPGREVSEKIYSFWREFDRRISPLPRHPQRQTKSQIFMGYHMITRNAIG